MPGQIRKRNLSDKSILINFNEPVDLLQLEGQKSFPQHHQFIEFSLEYQPSTSNSTANTVTSKII